MVTLVVLSMATAVIMSTKTTYFTKVSLSSMKQMNFTDVLNVRGILECAKICSQSSECDIFSKHQGKCYFIDSSATETIGTTQVSSLHINSQFIEKCSKQAYTIFLQDGFCWKEYNITTTDWSTASTTCEQDGGRLILMRKWEIGLKKLRLSDMNLSANQYFIGGNDLDVEGVWVWNDGSPMSMTDGWKPGEPDNWNNREDCLELRYPYPRFFDTNCLQDKPFICEIELF